MLKALFYLEGKRRVAGLPALSSVLALLGLALAMIVLHSSSALDGTVDFYSANRHVMEGQVWRLLTYTLFHGSAVHLASNLFTLGVFGWAASRCYADRTWLATYLLAAIVAAAARLLVSPDANLIGASAAVLALMGMSIVAVFRCHRQGFENPLGLPVIVPLVLLVPALFFLQGDAPTDVFAHVIGVLVGMLCGAFLPLSVLEAKPDRNP